jgi:hypothetical protein
MGALIMGACVSVLRYIDSLVHGWFSSVLTVLHTIRLWLDITIFTVPTLHSRLPDLLRSKSHKSNYPPYQSVYPFDTSRHYVFLRNVKLHIQRHVQQDLGYRGRQRRAEFNSSSVWLALAPA